MKKLKRRTFCKQAATSAVALSIVPQHIFDNPNNTLVNKKITMTNHHSNWHGEKCYYGFHFDLHVTPEDQNIGLHDNLEELVPLIKAAGVDWVETDGKGHTGLTSWFSRIPGASIGPGVIKDRVMVWREATKKLGLPLHVHYSGLWDISAGTKHPEWVIRRADGSFANRGLGELIGMKSPTGDVMCPRSPYLDELMIPQLLELIDHYDVDGFWIDGDWAMEPCYCDRCREAFRQKTGIAEPPKDSTDPNWLMWWNFTWESLNEYVTRYCDAVHDHRLGVFVCAAPLQTMRQPGEPKVSTDWISTESGEDTWSWSLIDRIRCEARFLSTRSKPWDYMARTLIGSWTSENVSFQPLQKLEQQAATVVAMGGNFQTCQACFAFGKARTGQLVPWQMNYLNELGKFVKSRRTLCQNTETIPQVAVLHSESHFYSTPRDGVLFHGNYSMVSGAVLSLLECHYGVDIFDEWALAPCLTKFPVVVAPEQNLMSEKFANNLKKYVRSGGKLLISGADGFSRFGEEFLGAKEGHITDRSVYHVPVADGTVPIESASWRLLDLAGATSLASIGTTPLPGEELLPHPSAILNYVGRGAVAYIPCDIFQAYFKDRYPRIRDFINNVLITLADPMDIKVDAPASIDAIFRRKDGKQIIHLINRSPGLPNLPDNKITEDVSPVGPIIIRMNLINKPKNVYLAFEKATIKWKYTKNTDQLLIEVPSVHIHAAIVTEN